MLRRREKLGLEIRASHRLETDLNVRRDRIGKRIRISSKRSSLLRTGSTAAVVAAVEVRWTLGDLEQSILCDGENQTDCGVC